jgi:transglutaminase-like putative cysteine protease
MKIAWLFFLLLLLINGAANLFGQSVQVNIVPIKTWVIPADFDKNAMPGAGQESSHYYLLLDEQENITQQESFVHYVYKILTNEGLQQMSDLSVDFDPSYEQLLFHSVIIHRNGKRIDQLPNKIRTIQREESMDRYLYDGSVTALINLVDMRVGDIVEYSFTRKGYNPVYEGHISRKINFNYTMGYEKMFQRLVTPSSLALSFKYVNTEADAEQENVNNERVYTWKRNKVPGYIADKQEPEWYNPYSYVLITSFKNWAEMASWSAKRFEVSDADRELVVKEIYPSFKNDSPEAYTLKVIRFVQDEIRYLGFESGLNSHRPHPPAQVYNQRFGDCKDKSLLLSTLLKVNGIESHPVLVNTSYRHKISDQLPSTNAFDHCVVQIKLKDRLFYVDPTISNQGGSLEQYYFPPYGKGLVVNFSSTDLVELPAPVPATISEVQTFDIDSIGGQGLLSIQTTYTGAEAESQRSYFSQNNLESVQKSYLTFYANIYPDIQKAESVQTKDDREANIFIVNEKYRIPSFWKPYQEPSKKIYCEFYPQTMEGYFNVSKSTQRTAPYRLPHPLDYSHEIIVNLPEEWTVTPDQQSIETDYYLYDYKVEYDDHHVSLLTHYKTKQPAIPVSDFPKFVEDHGKMMANLSYSLTYDRGLVQSVASKWPGAVLTILTVLIGAWLVFWLYQHYDPAPHYPSAEGQPIGGWLILVGIGLSFTPLRLLYDFITQEHLMNGTAWLTMWYTNSYGYFIFLFIEHIYNFIYLLFSILVLVLFFQRRSSVPRLISILYGASCVATILDNVIAAQMSTEVVIDTRDITRAIFAAAVWIPYFHRSERVKKTFVNTYRHGADQGD